LLGRRRADLPGSRGSARPVPACQRHPRTGDRRLLLLLQGDVLGCPLESCVCGDGCSALLLLLAVPGRGG
jgi:hypothetical protein